MRWWKALGVAAFVGVAATGAVIVRDQRQRRAYTPEQVRERLRERAALAEAAGAPVPTQMEDVPAVPAWRRRLRGAAKGVRDSAAAAALGRLRGSVDRSA